MNGRGYYGTPKSHWNGHAHHMHHMHYGHPHHMQHGVPLAGQELQQRHAAPMASRAESPDVPASAIVPILGGALVGSLIADKRRITGSLLGGLAGAAVGALRQWVNVAGIGTR